MWKWERFFFCLFVRKKKDFIFNLQKDLRSWKEQHTLNYKFYMRPARSKALHICSQFVRGGGTANRVLTFSLKEVKKKEKKNCYSKFIAQALAFRKSLNKISVPKINRFSQSFFYLFIVTNWNSCIVFPFFFYCQVTSALYFFIHKKQKKNPSYVLMLIEWTRKTNV